jgi:tRNA pseudouridine(38-40) synthase
LSSSVTEKDLPVFIKGDVTYSMSNLQSLHDISQKSGEFLSNNQKFQQRHTYVLSVGYSGIAYNGYQQRKGAENIHTVEYDIEFLLYRKVSAAGRTDKSVSALCQIISFTSYVEQEKTIDGLAMNAENILLAIEKKMRLHDESFGVDSSADVTMSQSVDVKEKELTVTTDLTDLTAVTVDEKVAITNNNNQNEKNSAGLTDFNIAKDEDKRKKKKEKFKKPSLAITTPPIKLKGNIRFWNCVRVSRKFHSLFSATWRRYIYIFPLNQGSYPTSVKIGENSSIQICVDVDVDVDVEFVSTCFRR